MNRLHKYLPSYYMDSKVFEEITKVESDEFDKLDLDIEDLSLQFVVDTATWVLAIYEKELHLPVRPNKSLDERRSIIKAKMRGIGKVDHLMIKAIVEAFTSNIVTIEFDGKINIVFTNQDKIPLDNRDMFHAINEIKPAHLDYKFEQRIPTTLKLETKYIRYDIPYPLCGTYLCGTHPYIATDGIILEAAHLNIQTKYINRENEYPITSEETVTGLHPERQRDGVILEGTTLNIETKDITREHYYEMTSERNDE